MHRWMSMLNNIGLPQSFHLTYIVEILILTVIIYELLIWVKNTRAWTLLKGIVVVTAFALISYFFHLTTLTWLMSKTAGVLVTVVVIVFQPELRRALEYMGRSQLMKGSFSQMDKEKGKHITAQIIRAIENFSANRVGALMVFEKETSLMDIIETGTVIDAEISDQLLISFMKEPRFTMAL